MRHLLVGSPVGAAPFDTTDTACRDGNGTRARSKCGARVRQTLA
ncbi:hypothetical protein BRPE64_ACDS28200 [Caballeronia insecticola]|uniref:Uncharacterized protein n=1 Tax=Caballeronia insecticola TaxID=758793 RepID=R4WJJ9_9BURK|nr:hypothetical protein BRPE64_ACDS28200 [Caballeronia insecticola]